MLPAKPNFKSMTDEEIGLFLHEYVQVKFTLNGRLLGKLPVKDREDAKQAVFLDLWINRNNYDPSKGSFSTYAFYRGKAIVKHFLYENKKHSALITSIVPGRPSSNELVELKDELKYISQSMTETERYVLLLKYLKNKTLMEISNMTGLTIGRVRKILSSLSMRFAK